MLELEIPPLLASREPVTAWFLETHDLALAKLAAGREKDIEFVTEALIAGLVDRGRLERGIDLMPERHREGTRTRLAALLMNLDFDRTNPP
jgi:hypothetical protein